MNKSNVYNISMANSQENGQISDILARAKQGQQEAFGKFTGFSLKKSTLLFFTALATRKQRKI